MSCFNQDYLTVASGISDGRSRSLSASDLSKIADGYTSLLRPSSQQKSRSYNSISLSEKCGEIVHTIGKDNSKRSVDSPDSELDVGPAVTNGDCAIHENVELPQLEISLDDKPLKPPRPKKTSKFQLDSNNDDNNNAASNANSIPSQTDKTDLDTESMSGMPLPRPIPKPKPRMSLIKAAMNREDGMAIDVPSKMTRTASYEKALEDAEIEKLVVSKAGATESERLYDFESQTNESSSKAGSGLPVSLTRSLSRSAGDLVNVNELNPNPIVSTESDIVAAQSAQQNSAVKPLRPAPPPPKPKPNKTKVLSALSLTNIPSDAQVQSNAVCTPSQAFQQDVVEQKSRRGSTTSTFSDQPVTPQSSNGFRMFPLPNFLMRSDSTRKSTTSSVFYFSPQQDIVEQSRVTTSQSVPGSLNNVSRELRVLNEDDFALREDDSPRKVPSDVGNSQGSRTSTLSSSSSNVSDLSSDVCRSSSSLRRGSQSSLSLGSRASELPSPGVNFEEKDEEARQKMMDEMKRKAFRVAMEIAETEQTFVEVLQLLNQDFRNAVESVKDEAGRPVLAEGVLNQIIRYLPQLQLINKDLLADLQARVKNWSIEPKIADVFVKKGAFLKMYTEYIRDFESMVALLEENRQKIPAFDKVVNNFENGPLCKKLAVRHYMLKPVQRIPQYRLLLLDYCKHLMPDSPDYQDTQAALVIVSEVADHANHSMKYLETVKHLREIQSSLIGQFEVIQPGRLVSIRKVQALLIAWLKCGNDLKFLHNSTPRVHISFEESPILIKEGVLNKLSRKEMQPRMFYLFNDTLLYTTPVSSGYKLNNVLPLNKMRVSKPTKEDFQNEFSIISTQRSFTISARTEQERTEWLTALEKAITESLQKRLSYNSTQQKGRDIRVEIDPKNLKVGMVPPVWIPDDRVSMCMLCQNEFTLAFRRHHCRGCGKVICKGCSDYKAPLRYLDYRPERVCSECFDTLERAVYKMGSDEVVKSSNGLAFSGKDLRALFRGYHLNRSKSMHKPTKLSEISASAKEVDASGYLKIWKNRSWKKMWFVVKGNVLYMYKASEDAAAEESMPLLGYEVLQFNTAFQGVDTNVLFELNHRGTPSIIFRTENEQSKEKWMAAMRRATVP